MSASQAENTSASAQHTGEAGSDPAGSSAPCSAAGVPVHPQSADAAPVHAALAPDTADGSDTAADGSFLFSEAAPSAAADESVREPAFL